LIFAWMQCFKLLVGVEFITQKLKCQLPIESMNIKHCSMKLNSRPV